MSQSECPVLFFIKLGHISVFWNTACRQDRGTCYLALSSGKPNQRRTYELCSVTEYLNRIFVNLPKINVDSQFKTKPRQLNVIHLVHTYEVSIVKHWWNVPDSNSVLSNEKWLLIPQLNYCTVLQKKRVHAPEMRPIYCDRYGPIEKPVSYTHLTLPTIYSV